MARCAPLAGLLALALLSGGARAADNPSTQPVLSLEQLSLQTQRLYRHVRLDVIRVKLPTPDWLRSINEQQALLQKWGTQLTPQVRQLFLERQQQLATMMRGEAGFTTGPSTAPSTQPGLVTDPRLLRSRLVLVATGLMIDGDGHALLPAFIDAQTLNGRLLTVVTGDGRLAMARLIGADRPSNLSVLQLDVHDLPPAALAASRPAEGSLVMTLNGDGVARLVIWNPATPDPGLVVLPDGQVAGFSANGRFLAATACRPIVAQILATGSVHRAVLGVRVREVDTDGLLRSPTTNPAARPPEMGSSAMRIDAVEPDSPAARAGLQPGDLILTAGGQAVEDTATFAALIATQHGRTALTVLRDQQIRTVNVELLSPP